MPIRAALPDPVERRPTRSRPPGGRSTMRRLAVLIGAPTIMIPVAPAYAGELLINGGFESGTFNGWTTTQPASPLTPWTVATAADSGYFVLASPQEGTYDALNGSTGTGQAASR